MSIATIQHQLSTPVGFAAAVESKSRLLGAALTTFVISAIGIGLNLFQLGSATEWDWPIMFRHFFEADAIHFIGSRAGKSEFYRYLAVWAPVVLVPLGLILLLIHFATRSKAGANQFADFQQRGWIGAQRPLGIEIKVGNQTTQLAIFGQAQDDMSSIDQLANQYNQYLSTLDKSGKKQVVAAASKAKALRGTVASNVDQNLPGQMIIGPVQKTALSAIIPPLKQGGEYKILPIKA